VLLRDLEQHWRNPDNGIWEIRGDPQHFTHSKVMAWVAFDRAVRTIEEYGLKGDLDRWRAVRDQIHEEVCREGFDEKLGSFTQFYGSGTLDASLLLIPLVGFLRCGDPRVRGTIEAVRRELTWDGLVLRYRSEEHVDGLPAGEGVFLPCSFWLVDCLELIGEHDDAHALFERLLGLRNDLGLISEEYHPGTKRLLGNFPQAFTHLELVNSAFNLAKSHGSPMELRHARR
jgi:GH15 family glucan-1,4-alpha-glucosidase